MNTRNAMSWIRQPALISISAALFAAGYAAAQPVAPCGEFVSTANPGQGVASTVLTAVAAKGALGFATGRFYPTGSGAFTPVLYRFDGSSWRNQNLPALPSRATNPVLMSAGMSSLTPDRAWIVGYVTVPPTTNNLPLIARWRNGSFDRVDTPSLRPQTIYPYDPRAGFANDIYALNDNDIWVVGQATGYGDALATSVGMALHWDGSHWIDVPTPIVANRSHSFEAVSASAPDNVWAVGSSRSVGQAFLGMIQRWNGSQWIAVSHPALTIEQSQFYDVLALSPSEVWVAGAVNYTDPLLYRWNGSSWQNMPLPGGSGVIALVGTAPNDIWATSASNSIFHWDGAMWTEVPNPAPPPGQVDSARALAIAGPCDVWSVGAQMDINGFNGALIEHLVPGCGADFNADGTLDFFDYLDFVSVFSQSQPAADFNHDSVIDFFDYLDFVDAFAGGC